MAFASGGASAARVSRCRMSVADRNQREMECPDIDAGGPRLVPVLSPRNALRHDHAPGPHDVPGKTDLAMTFGPHPAFNIALPVAIAVARCR